LQAFEKTFEEHPDIKVCIFDHISSNPPLIFPAKEITKYLKSKGVIVVVDGV
jgi:selenocysteine lyase/cysteine desulfurase